MRQGDLQRLRISTSLRGGAADKAIQKGSLCRSWIASLALAMTGQASPPPFSSLAVPGKDALHREAAGLIRPRAIA